MKKAFLMLYISLLLCVFCAAPALAAGKVWSNCTVGLTEIAPGDVIRENVILINDTGKDLSGPNNFCVHYGQEGLLDLGHDSTKGWVQWTSVEGKPLIETVNIWSGPFIEFPVINSMFYVDPPLTADSTHLTLWSVMFLLSAASTAVLLMKKKRFTH